MSLTVQRLHRLLVVARPFGRSRRERGVEPGDIARRQHHVKGTGVFLQALHPLGPRDRKDVLFEQPYQGELGGAAFLFRGDFLEVFY